jgi:hypothetical protein
MAKLLPRSGDQAIVMLGVLQVAFQSRLGRRKFAHRGQAADIFLR